MKYVDYTDHVIYSPDTYHRRYDFDLPQIPNLSKRILLAALPFIGLWKPAGYTLSIGMNGSRAFSHISHLLTAEESFDLKAASIEFGKASLALLALSTTVFHFTSALLLTTSCDTLQSSSLTLQHLWDHEYEKALDEGLQTIASVAYLSFMITGGLEAMVLFAAFQGLSSLYLARKEFQAGHYIEGFSKLAMASLRFKQTHGYIKQIERRNALLELEKMRNLIIKLLRAKQASHLIHHPLSSLQEQIESKEVFLPDEKGNDTYFGSHFHGHGKQLVKGENLIFRTKTIDGKEVIELDFKINHAYRADLATAIQEIQGIRKQDMRDLLSIGGSHAKNITFSSASMLSSSPNFYDEIGTADKIELEGLGSIMIGASPSEPNLYDRVVIHMTPDKTVYDLHELLCWVNLDTALSLSTKDDIERLKMGHLFRTFFPKEATPFERTKEFFNLPIADLKAKMIQTSPEMATIFETYYHKMHEEHLFDGRIRYRIEGLADAARKEGAKALTAAIMGAHSEKELFDRVASMLKMGMLSTTVRNENNFGKHGLGGGGIDYLSGGADSVYTQILTEKMIEEQREFDDFYYESEVRLLISLEALELGSYQYYTDALGNRMYDEKTDNFNWWWWQPESYATRDNILEFIRKEQSSPYFYAGHEVMLKERVAPSFFQGLVVPDQGTKDNLIKHLTLLGLISSGTLLGKPVDKFIHISDCVTEELFS